MFSATSCKGGNQLSTPFTIYKLIVLYMLQNTEDTLTNSQISEFILEREYTNYFHLQQAISELVEAELITMDTRSNTSHYRITEDGKRPSPFFKRMSLLRSNRKSENI